MTARGSTDDRPVVEEHGTTSDDQVPRYFVVPGAGFEPALPEPHSPFGEEGFKPPASASSATRAWNRRRRLATDGQSWSCWAK